MCNSETLALLAGITHNESHVCDVALSPTRARGHVAERCAAAPRSPSRPAGAAMYIRAVMRCCAIVRPILVSRLGDNLMSREIDNMSEKTYIEP